MSNTDFIKNMKSGYDDYYHIPKFNYLSYIYDFILYLSFNFPHKFSNRLIRNICKRFKLKRKKILDIGSFTGYYSFFFHAERNKVTGIELSNKINYAKKRYRFYDINFLQGDVIEVLDNLDKRTFDFIFCSNLPLHYDTGDVTTSEHFKAFIKKSIQHIESGGMLYYIFYASKHNKVSYPVTESGIRKFAEDNNIGNYTVETNNLLIEETVEFIIRKE